MFPVDAPMPLWLQLTLLAATAVLVWLVWCAWRIGKAERAKAALAERSEPDQEHWAAYQRYGEPPVPEIAALAPIGAKHTLLARLLAVVVAALSLSACSLTPTQQKWAGFAAGVLVVGAIAAHDADSGKPIAPPDKKRPFIPCPGGANPQDCK